MVNCCISTVFTENGYIVVDSFMRQFFVMKTLAIDTIAALVAFMGNATRKVLFLFYFLWPEEEPW